MNYESEIQSSNEELKKRIAELETAVSKCKQAQKELRDSEALYFTLFNNANDLIHIISPAGKILSANKKWLTVLEYTLDEAKELMVTDVLQNVNMQTIMKRMQRAKENESVRFDAVFESVPDSAAGWVLQAATSPFHPDPGNPLPSATPLAWE